MSPFRPPHDPVIAEDAHLVGGEAHRQQTAGCLSRPCSHRLGCCQRRGGAVVAVGDIERTDPVEPLRQRFDLVGAVNRPERMRHRSTLHGAAERRPRAGRGDQAANLFVRPVNQEQGACLRAERFNVPGAILHLGRPGRFVPLDRALLVGREGGRSHQPRLRAALRLHAPGVEAGSRIADQDSALDHPRECRRCTLVERRRAGWRLGRQVDLRPGDVEEAPRTPLRGGPRLLCGEHVIGRRQHCIRMVRGDAEPSEGREQSLAHVVCPFLVTTVPVAAN